MITFAQFYDKSICSDELIEVCGDRGIVQLDGREKLASQIEVCDKYSSERNYKGYRILKGDTINRGVTEVYCNCNGIDVEQDLINKLEDVVNELDLSEAAISEHGQCGTAPSELVRIVLAQKDDEIAMLKSGLKSIN
jgi:hypothetical protein